MQQLQLLIYSLRTGAKCSVQLSQALKLGQKSRPAFGLLSTLCLLAQVEEEEEDEDVDFDLFG